MTAGQTVTLALLSAQVIGVLAGVGATGGVGGAPLVGLAVRTAAKVAVGFVVAGFAGAGLAHVRAERATPAAPE